MQVYMDEKVRLKTMMSTYNHQLSIEIWGMYPPPIGGVSMHIRRLICALNKIGRVTLKDFIPKQHYEVDFVIPVHKPYKEVLGLIFSRRRLIHNEHFSYLLFLCFLLFGRKHVIGMTIHNQRSLLIKSKMKELICKMFFRQCQFIIMNDEFFSYKFSEKFKIPHDKIHILPAFLPPDISERRGLPDFVLDFRKTHDFIISANGYKLRKDNGIDVYGLDLIIELINRLQSNGINAGLIFCLPVVGDKDYYIFIKNRITELNLNYNVLFVEGEKENGFEFWEVSDLFIRPTMTDMEGISVKEALYMGTPVIASDVCIRPKECILFKNRDKEDLYNKVYDLYKTGLYNQRVKYDCYVDVAQATWDIYKSVQLE